MTPERLSNFMFDLHQKFRYNRDMAEHYYEMVDHVLMGETYREKCDYYLRMAIVVQDIIMMAENYMGGELQAKVEEYFGGGE
jgi:hypothetical protein